jgi:hypothetical protein
VFIYELKEWIAKQQLLMGTKGLKNQAQKEGGSWTTSKAAVRAGHF